MEIWDKNILSQIANKSDDETALKLLQLLFKKYPRENQEVYYDNIFGSRYPQLLKFKHPDEGLKGLYLRMLKYIGLLRENFEFVYTKAEKENPILIYGFKKYELENEGINSLLIRASLNGNLEIVKTSLEAGANIHAEHDEALILASLNGHLSVAKYLVERGADIHARDNEALRAASKDGDLSVVQYLVEKGADIPARYGEALLFASKYGRLPVVQYLVERGADIHADNDKALILVSYNGRLPVVQYLL